MRPRLLTSCSLSCVLWAASGFAQAEDVISTDRPGTAESSTAMAPGRFQVEMGYAQARESKDAPRSRTHTTPLLLRIGLTDRVELRLETDGLVQDKLWLPAGPSTTHGTSDLAFGLKWQMAPSSDSDSAPSAAWLFHVDAPTGSAPFREQGMRPSARYVAEWDWGTWSLGVMPGLYTGHNDANQRYVGGIFAVSLGAQLNDRTHAFFELSADQLTSRKNGGNHVSLGTGLAYRLADRVQLDFAVAKGLTQAAPKQQWTTGVSVMF